MGQITTKLRNTTDGFDWWCIACGECHPLPYKKGWTFDGNIEFPTFTPSFKHTGIQSVIVDGKWTGDWILDENGNTKDWCCHYIITSGIIHYCNDCTHTFAGKIIPMPDLPDYLQDVSPGE